MFTLCSESWLPNQNPAAPDGRSFMLGRFARRGFGAGASSSFLAPPSSPAPLDSVALELSALCFREEEEPFGPSSSNSRTIYEAILPHLDYGTPTGARQPPGRRPEQHFSWAR